MISICIIGSISGFLVSFAVTGIIRIYALRRNLIDHPNERSSHTIPTPRGGGIGIVCACIGAICAAALLGELSLYHSLALGGGGLAVALIGFLDDHTDIPARYRFLVHLGAAIFFLFFAWYGVPLNNYSVVIMTGVSIFSAGNSMAYQSI